MMNELAWDRWTILQKSPAKISAPASELRCQWNKNGDFYRISWIGNYRVSMTGHCLAALNGLWFVKSLRAYRFIQVFHNWHMRVKLPIRTRNHPHPNNAYNSMTHLFVVDHIEEFVDKFGVCHRFTSISANLIRCSMSVSKHVHCAKD